MHVVILHLFQDMERVGELEGVWWRKTWSLRRGGSEILSRFSHSLSRKDRKTRAIILYLINDINANILKASLGVERIDIYSSVDFCIFS